MRLTIINRHFVSVLSVLSLAAGVAFSAPSFADAPANGGDIVIRSVQGDVRVTVRGEEKAARKDTVLALPARVRTGNASSIELRQGKTSIEAAASTQLEIPAPAAKGDPVERVIQQKGNAFYNVGKRELKKLRVETPYLVAVVKGTQFNVAVQDESTTISLFEGRLEIRSPDDLDVVTLLPGQIAIRGSTESRIRVIRMDTGQPVANAAAPGAAPSDASTSAGTTQSSADAVGALTARTGAGTDSAGNTGADPNADRSADSNGAPNGDRSIAPSGARIEIASVNGNTAIDSSINANVGGTTADVGASVTVGTGELSASADIGASIGETTVDVGAGASLTGGTANVSLDAGVDLGGSVSASAGANTAIDLGAGSLTASTGASIDVGSVSAGLNTGASIDVGAGTAAIDAGTSIDLGGAASVGVDTGTSIDLGTASVDTGTTLTTPIADVGASASVSSGGVSAGVDVGGISAGLNVDLGAGTIGVDLGLGGSSSTSTSTSTGTTTGGTTSGGGGGLVDGVVGGLRGLLGRP